MSWFSYLTCESGRLCDNCVSAQKLCLMAILSFSACEADIRTEGSDEAGETRRCEASMSGMGCDLVR